MKRILLPVFFISLAATTCVFGHGVEFSTFTGGVGIEVAYEHGQPLVGASVHVYAPGSQDAPFQQGATDQNGRFTFVPDTSGAWKIDVDDGTGHGVIEEIIVSDDMIPEIKNHLELSRGQKILVGVCVIFGITGFGYYISAKKHRSEG